MAGQRKHFNGRLARGRIYLFARVALEDAGPVQDVDEDGHDLSQEHDIVRSGGEYVKIVAQLCGSLDLNARLCDIVKVSEC